jgi:hypothetical protein
MVMPHYFFDVVNGHHLSDPAGLDCANDEHAKTQGTKIARVIAEEVPTAVKRRRIAITDIDGRHVASVKIDQ